MKGIIKHFTQHPNKLFLVDAVGAVISILLLQLLKNYLGVTNAIANYLSIIAVSLFSFSAICFITNMGNKPILFLLLSIGNMLYCLATLLMLVNSYANISNIGYAYFTVEVVIILVLVAVEIGLYKSLKKRTLN